MNILKPTGDRKTRFRNAQKNTFGLYPGPTGDGTCPYATLGEGGCSQIKPGRKLPTCYVFRTITAYKNVGPALLHNTNLLRTATHTEKVALLTSEFKRFHRIESEQADPKMFYRLHWSGDIFDQAYAEALSEAMCAFPDITFWNYTRSFSEGAWLAFHTPNLLQYFSLDVVNIEPGLCLYFTTRDTKGMQGQLLLSYMSPVNDFAARYAELRSRHAIWPEGAPVLTACPTDEQKLPVADACSKCRKCLTSKHIWFKTK